MKKIVLIVLLALIFISCDSNQKKPPMAKNGILDLRGWDFGKDGNVDLKGEWEFYWGKYYRYDDFHSEKPPKKSAIIDVPGNWENTESLKNSTGKAYPKKGYATYRLTILLEKDSDEFAIWFKNNNFLPALTLFNNKSSIFKAGVHSHNNNDYLLASTSNRLLKVRAINDSIELIVHLSNQMNYNFLNGLYLQYFKIGLINSIMESRDSSNMIQLFTFGLIFMTSLYFFFVFMLRKSEKVSLYFSLFCLSLCLTYIWVEGFHYIFFDNSYNYSYNFDLPSLFLLSVPWYSYPIFLFLTIYELYPNEYNKTILKILIIYYIIIFIPNFLIFIDYGLVCDFSLICSQLYRIVWFLAFFYHFYVLTKSIKRKRIGANIFLISIIITLLLSTNDVLLFGGVIERSVALGTYATLCMIIALTFILSKRYANAFKTVESQTIELQHHKEHLEELVDERTFELKTEKDKSDKLLLNVLPQPIAERLKSGEAPIADQFDEASIIFIDIADFTKMSAKISPQAVVRELNKIFTIFDKITAKFSLEKIKTIGDCFMAAAGIPEPRIDHADAIANMALEVMKVMEGYKTDDGYDIKFRIGLDCGPIVAGVIGEQKFIYDLWGDPVNTASRMENFGVIGKIQCTERFRSAVISHRVIDDNQFHFEERGEIEVKGKGMMKTYFLIGIF